jgi:hypothetical protein
MNPMAAMMMQTLLSGLLSHFMGGKQQQMPQPPAQLPQQPPQQGAQMAQMQAAQAGQQQQMNPAMQMLLALMQQGGSIG